MSTSNPRRNKGRRKIEMKKMTNENNLQVTFSKRRNGLFKKASELCTLCGVKVALVVFSPADKPFSFGDPSVNEVIDRYQMRAPPPPQNLGNMHFLEAPRNVSVLELNAQLNHVNEDLDIEKKCSDALNQERKEVQEHLWWAAPVEEINAPQLDQLKLALENLKNNVIGIVESQNFIQGGGAVPPPPQFFPGGPSSSNNPLQLHMPPPQQFPMHPPPPPPPSALYQNQPGMLPNHMFDGAMMRQTFFNNNNMGGFGPAGGFF